MPEVTSLILCLIFTADKRSLRRLCFYTRLSVILFTGGGVPGQVTPWAGTPHWQVHPQAGTPPQSSTSPWAGTSPLLVGTPPPGQVHPQAGTPPWADTPPKGTPPWQCMLGYGQQVGGTHPTGIHSCFLKIHFEFNCIV